MRRTHRQQEPTTTLPHQRKQQQHGKLVLITLVAVLHSLLDLGEQLALPTCHINFHASRRAVLQERNSGRAGTHQLPSRLEAQVLFLARMDVNGFELRTRPRQVSHSSR
jgi:hypothetical protein